MIRRWFFLVLVVTVALLGACSRSHPAPSAAATSSQTTFPSPQAAVEALATAARDNNTTALTAMFGPQGQALVFSGDPAEDVEARHAFTQSYQQMHRLARSSDGAVTLYVGADNWPFPIPLTETQGVWRFDTGDGAQEVLFRRIGRNETNAIAVCRQVVAAEREYNAKFGHYAQHFVSDPGTKDGLFWTGGAGANASPVGPLLAFASQEGAAKANHQPTPFHGYYFRMLKDQPSGTYAFLAYPARYRDSGVMTFLVTQDGVVYQRNLGPDTITEARGLSQPRLDPDWHRAN